MLANDDVSLASLFFTWVIDYSGLLKSMDWSRGVKLNHQNGHIKKSQQICGPAVFLFDVYLTFCHDLNGPVFVQNMPDPQRQKKRQ